MSLHSLNWFLVPEGCLEIPFTAKELLPHSVTAGKAASCPISPGHSMYYLQGREIGWVPLHQLVFSAGLPHAVLCSPMSRFLPLAHCKASTVPQSLSVGCRWTFIHGCKISLVETCAQPERESEIFILEELKGKISLTLVALQWSCLKVCCLRQAYIGISLCCERSIGQTLYTYAKWKQK